MRIDKKGFAISTMLYGLIFVTIAIFYMIIALVSNRYEHNVSFVEDLRENLEVTGELQTSLNQKIEEKQASCTPTIRDTDGTVYFSGLESCVNFNYVWYSGKLWRIVAIYSDGTMKMVTNDVMTVLSGGTADYDKSSYIYKWLNNDFKDTLYNYDNLIVTNYSWNKTRSDSYTNVLPKTTMIDGTVGLLNAHEYYKAYQNSSYSSNYLRYESNNFWLMNGIDNNNMYFVNSSGTISTYPYYNYYGIRPAVVLRSHVYMNGGSGTYNDPYTIEGDIASPLYGESLLNERVSGEYVRFYDSIYRIVDVEPDGSVRMTGADMFRYNGSYLRKRFGTSFNFGSGGTETYWNYYLNNYWANSRLPSSYRNLLVSGPFYLGSASYDYRTTVCDLVEENTTIKYCIKNSKIISKRNYRVGFLRYGEMFAAQGENAYRGNFYLVTPRFLVTTSQGISMSASLTSTYPAKIVIFIRNGAIIRSGSGTKNNPFNIA